MAMEIIPAPRVTSPASGTPFVLDEHTALTAGPEAAGEARRLRSALGAATGFPLLPGRGGLPGGGRARIHLEVDPSLPDEGYRLEVGAERVGITGGGPAGVSWGGQTLRQLLGPDAFRRAPLPDRAWRLEPGVIEDAPRFAWRGMLLDVARHFMPKDGVLRYLDLLAAHKLNVLHLHLTDDQGWRIEIQRYPRLTEQGAWRERSMLGGRQHGQWEERPHGGFYTQDDIREIVAYAAERHIAVVPEIDVPGHSQAAIAAYPELGNTDAVDTGSLAVWTRWGINENVLAPTDAVLAFYENVLTEVLALFPGRFVHIGGDECPKAQWKASPAVRARIAELGLNGEDELQSWFIRHFDTWLAERGRRLIGWDEILEGGLAAGAAVSSWRGYAGGIAAAEAGHDVVMCPEQQVYLDHRQAEGEQEPIPVGYVRTLEDVYRFEPVPPQLAGTAEAAHVIGTQANVWTEMMDSARYVDYMAFPRLCAFSEVAWSSLAPPLERDFADFEHRMDAHYRRLDALGVEYRPPGGPLPWQRRPGVLGRPIEGPPPIV
ncbi:beta-N-acetylhexosaminidase [Wenjunlia tyrosinilytica]|uniref:beta-N-acetylhexosaminidase n=2 Tax=Wenjunlia tyrosinilytica TaxID=1544741 RepID=A0A918E050_9ACTN|nr:beta-N-acetylhexosaminidase [Wenjunlia tyrosinilytica]GGO97481.1 beta-N-acetylhexosaminidase [Wenjunlia tyrosinilytica]